MSRYALAVLGLFLVWPGFVNAQDDTSNESQPQEKEQEQEDSTRPFLGGTRFGFDPVVAQFGSHVFFAADSLDDGEIKIFGDGNLTSIFRWPGRHRVLLWRRKGSFRV